MSKLVEAAAEFLSRDTSTKQSKADNDSLLLSTEEFANLSEEDQEMYLQHLEQLDELTQGMKKLARKFIPGQGRKQAVSRAKDQGYTAGMDRAVLKYNPDDKDAQKSLRTSTSAQQRYKRISRGEAPFKPSAND